MTVKRDKHWQRRDTLKLAGTLGLTGISPTLTHANMTTNNNLSYDVIIVGAGMAGMYAAKTLKEKGHRVLVLEASDRRGGRIYSKTLGETRIELGAEEHYLKTNNPIYDQVVEAFGKDIYTQPYTGDSMLVMEKGQSCWEESGDCEDDKDIVNYWNYLEHYSSRTKHTDYSLSMADDIYEHHKVSPGHRAYHLYENSIAGSIYGTSLENLGIASLARQDVRWTLSGSIRAIAKTDLGYSDVLDKIWWQTIISNIRLNSVVAEINTTDAQCLVTLQGGKKFIAEKVIVTASIGVLQSEQIKFVPTLPAQTIDAYSNIGMGRGMKVALRFTKAFWGKKLGYLITNGLVSSCWAPTSYKVESNDHVLMCYPMGSNSEILVEMSESLGEEEEGDKAIILALLEDLDSTFNGMATQAYLDGLVQNWNADPYVRGSYSYPTTSTYAHKGANKRSQLAIPVDNKLFFAGEGTNSNNPASVPGALQEGERAAMQIHDLLTVTDTLSGITEN